MSLLVDTSVLVDVERNHPPALAWLKKAAHTPIYVSAVTVFELHVGADLPGSTKRVANLLESVVIVPVDAAVAARGGEVLRRYESSHGMGRLDALIAATALVARLPLVTLNTKHFPGVKDVRKPY